MNEQQNLKKYATNHYSHYPEGTFPSYLAYGFRPMFVLLAPYIVFSIILWAFVWTGILNISFTNDILTWHMYEMLYGIGTAGIIAFFLTGAPELFPGVVPIVGKRLIYIIGFWLLGRMSFWMIDIVGVYFVALTNIPMIAYIASIVTKPVLLDPNRRHYSFVYMLVILLLVQIWFFASVAQLVPSSPMEILKVALGAFLVLILVALRRINMEAINELLEDLNIDETFKSKPYRYNLAIFTILVYTIIEFFYPTNSILGWICFASGAAILGILNDFNLKDHNILFKPFVIYMMSILFLFASGYFLMGYDYLSDEIYAINHFRHFLTTGVYGLVFLMVLIIVSTVHTGRHIETNIWTHLAVIFIIVSTVIRSCIPFYESYATSAYITSSFLWALSFVIYIILYYKLLFLPRADGLPG